MNKKLILLGIVFLLVLPFVFADTLILQTANNSNLQDAKVTIEGGGENTNYGGITSFNLISQFENRAYFTFNISGLPAGSDITEVQLYIYEMGAEGSETAYIYQVYASWAEMVITRNNQPCGTAFDSSTNCNLTTEDTTTIGDGTGWKLFTVTGMTRKAFATGDGNVSMVVRPLPEAENYNNAFWTKEYSGDITLRPYLNITYTSTPTPEEFTITAKDIYDSSTINNFTVIIKNSTETYINITTTGDITFANISNGIYNITINSSQNGGYFNVSYLNYNVSTDLEGQLFQSLLNLYVNDSLSGNLVSSFNVTTNYSAHSGTNGYVLLYSKAGTHHILNISSSQYPMQSFSYSINTLENKTMIINLSPTFNFYLRREADNSIFDWNATNTTKLTVYCPNKNINIYFNTSANATKLIDCPYTLMKIFVDFDGSTYFRTLIPPTNQRNVTWWLLDLNKDTGVQVILELIDLVGEWADGILRVQTAIGERDEDIIEQRFDISDAVVLYLLKDAFYTLSIENAEGTERALGSLIADAAGTKTITYPNIPFYPEETILEDNISWSYTFNTTAQILRFQYLDTTAKTTYLRWRIYNGSNQTHLLSSFTANSNSSLIFTYQPVHTNHTYFTHLFIQHPDLGYNISEYRVFSDYEDYLGLFEGFEDTQDLAMYVSIIFLVVWGLLFSAKHAGLGMTSTFIWTLILKWRGFFPISWLWLGLIGFIAILGWVVEAMKK